MKKLQIYSVMYLDRDGAEHEVSRNGYDAAIRFAKELSRNYGEATLEGVDFIDYYADGKLIEREQAA